jgi:cation diffusion facilitator CzcD-associated flavoprotein CzcO
MNTEEVIIIGAGPYGLSVAATLKQKGIDALVLERGDGVADSWRRRHPQLRLNTHRTNSGLPGSPISKSAGTFPDVRTYLTHLAQYAQHNKLRIKTGADVRRIERCTPYWRVETSSGNLSTRQLVVATGFDHTPVIPSWPGLNDFRGELRHAADFGSAEDYRDKSVLVVGAGNSGGDLLNVLSRVATRSLGVSVRRGPVVLPSRLAGFPLMLTAPLLDPLPVACADIILSLTERLAFGDVGKLGLRKGPARAISRLRDEHVAPAIDNGFVAAIRAGKIQVYPQIVSFDNNEVVFDDDSRQTPDIVIAATGYDCGLEPMIGHLGLLKEDGRPLISGTKQHPQAPGLWLALMTPPLGGALRAIRNTAEPVAQAIVAYSRALASGAETQPVSVAARATSGFQQARTHEVLAGGQKSQ